MNTRYLPLHKADTGQWTLLTCPHHTARDIEIHEFKEWRGTFYEVRCRLCGCEQEAHDAVPVAPSGRGKTGRPSDCEGPIQSPADLLIGVSAEQAVVLAGDAGDARASG